MARTKSFKELVQHHVKRDAKFAEALLREGVDARESRHATLARRWPANCPPTRETFLKNCAFIARPVGPNTLQFGALNSDMHLT